MSFQQYPFLRITLSMATGILVGDRILQEPRGGIIWMLVFGCFVITYFLILKYRSGKFRKILLLVGTSGFFILGIGVVNINRSLLQYKIDEKTFGQTEYYTVAIDSKPVSKKNSKRVEATLLSYQSDDSLISCNEKIILYFKDSVAYDLGDKVLIAGKFNLIQKVKNPYAFDYQQYLARQGVFLDAFVPAGNHKLVSYSDFSLRYLSIRMGDHLDAIISSSILADREQKFVKAMILGRRDEIDPEMAEAYSLTGTTHILAVSGLHVGIIFFLASFIFRALKRKNTKLLYYILVLCSIWLFAIITGLSPSVKRASIMITIVLIGQFMNRENSVINSLLISAFLLLLLSPNLLFSVSFQLSYAAVFGIVLMYDRIYNLIKVPNFILDFFWKITAISLSVQLLTFPITIYYFHQFPLLFPITNLIAIPTAMFILYGGILLLLVSPITLLEDLVAWIIEKWAYLYNECIHWFGELSYVAIQNITLSTQLVCALLVFALLFIWACNKQKDLVPIVLSVGLMTTTLIYFTEQSVNLNQKKITFYSGLNYPAVDIFAGSTCYSNINDRQGSHFSSYRYSVHPNRSHSGIRNAYTLEDIKSYKEFGKNQLLILEGVTFLFLNDLSENSIDWGSFSVDYCYVTDKVVRNHKETLESIDFNLLITDQPHQFSLSKSTEEDFDLINAHSLKRDGALVITL